MWFDQLESLQRASRATRVVSRNQRGAVTTFPKLTTPTLVVFARERVGKGGKPAGPG